VSAEPPFAALATRPVGSAVLALGLVGFAIALTLLRRRTRAGDSRWWSGYARDLTNLAGLLVAWAGLWLIGLPGPIALLAGFCVSLLLYILDYLLTRALSPELRWPTTVAALALAAGTLAQPAALARLLLQLLGRLF
jgi:hypothetical protein